MTQEEVKEKIKYHESLKEYHDNCYIYLYRINMKMQSVSKFPDSEFHKDNLNKAIEDYNNYLKQSEWKTEY